MNPIRSKAFQLAMLLTAVAGAAIAAAAGVLPPEAAIMLGAFGTVYTEGKRVGDVIKYELNPTLTRESMVVLSGEDLACGSVLGAQLVGGAATAAALATNTGDGAMGAITVGTAAKRGRHSIIVVEPAAAAGNFIHVDPDGVVVGKGTVAVAYSGGGLSFTLADGAADFVAGDGFVIEVTGGTLKAKLWDPADTDGGQNLAGILLFDTDASAADSTGAALVRGPAVVARDALTWATATAAQKAEIERQLAAKGIVVRASA